MRLIAPFCYAGALLMLCAALPLSADTRFQVRRMTRNDVPAGKGQCDIHLMVDNEVEVALRGDMLDIRTISGGDARDAGSECNAPLPDRDVAGFRFENVESRGEVRLIEEPSRRSRFAAIVHIRDGQGGGFRYHFRISWAMTGRDYDRPPARRNDEFDRPPARPGDDFNRPRGPEGGFSWNNVLNFRGVGRGRATTNDSGDIRLGEVSIDIDRGGKMMARFRSGDRGRPLTFTGQVLVSEGGRWKVDAMSEDRRLRGPMWISVDARNQVSSISLEATDGRDRMRLNWDRR